MQHTKYQGFGPYGFRQEDNFMIFPLQAYVKHVTPWTGHFGPMDKM